MAVQYNSVHFSLMILLLCAEANDQKSWACKMGESITDTIIQQIKLRTLMQRQIVIFILNIFINFHKHF